MEVTIKYYKSSSKYYETVCKKSEYFDNYVQDKSENTITLSEDELRTKISQINEILKTIRNWSKTEYFIDKHKVDVAHIQQLLQISTCEQECSHCALGTAEYCYENVGWGCRHLASIALRKETYYPYRSGLCWYDFGRFENDTWYIDKNHITEILMQEAQEKHLMFCSHFSKERIRKNVNDLLDQIVVNDDSEWEYKYRDAPIGMLQTEIIGVKPRKKHSEVGGISISSILGNSLGQRDNDQPARIIEKNVPSVTFSDIGGIDDIVQQIREVIELPLIAPAIFEHYSINPHKGILLYGPPGCGKTLIAKAVANEINAHFITVNGPEILNKYIGQSESNLRNIFVEAKENGPSVIYFDEFDSISATRDADGNPLMASVVNQLLTLMDGMDTSSQVCCIASTNRIDMIDAAIKRPGRFDYVIEIQHPSPDGCKAIFRIHTAKMPIVESFDKDAFVERYLTGCSGAEIAFVASEAAYNSIRRTVNIAQLFTAPEAYCISEDNVITEMDFIQAAKSLKASRQRADTAKYRYAD